MLPKAPNLTPSHILIFIFILHSFAFSYQQACNLHDQSSLLSFLGNISASSSLSSNWSSSTSCCQWEGIKCNTNGKVTHLELPSRGLEGVIIASSISNLIKLTHLNLSNNYLHGTLGEEILMLTSLMILDLSSNNLFGSIPWKIGNLAHLEKLYLHTNNLSGLIPPSLKSCTSLVEISLRNNHLNGDISNFDFSGFVQLQKLDLRINSLNGSLPDSIYSCKSLVAIGVSLNNLSGQISSRIAGLDSLSYLSLSHNHFTNITATLKVLAKCKSLSTLLLSYNFFNESLPIHETFVGLGDFPKLEILDLTMCNFGGPFPKWIYNFKRLRYLNLLGNKMMGTIPDWLGTLPNLTSLNLSQNNFSGKFPLKLCQLSGLLSPSADANSYFHFELPSIVLLPNKTSLIISTIYQGIDLSYNSLDGLIPLEIGNLRNLQQLLLGNNYFSGHIPTSISNLKKLEALDLSTNNLTGGIPTSFGGLSFLSEFDVSYNDLEGSIPSGGQLDTFEASSFEGNPSLCGAQLNRSCSHAPTLEAVVYNKSHHHSMHSFLNGLFVGFASGFSGVLAIVASYFWFKY